MITRHSKSPSTVRPCTSSMMMCVNEGGWSFEWTRLDRKVEECVGEEDREGGTRNGQTHTRQYACSQGTWARLGSERQRVPCKADMTDETLPPCHDLTYSCNNQPAVTYRMLVSLEDVPSPPMRYPTCGQTRILLDSCADVSGRYYRVVVCQYPCTMSISRTGLTLGTIQTTGRI